MNQKKILFIDRDGTLIEEPADKQVDRIEKLVLMPSVIPSLLRLIAAHYTLVMVSNQDGLGTPSFTQCDFNIPQEFMIRLFNSQGIFFDAIHICPHLSSDHCECRKPKTGLVHDYLIQQKIDRTHSYVIGDRETDMQFAANLGILGIRIGNAETPTWVDVANSILAKRRVAVVSRKTNETDITVKVNLDHQDEIKINTGIGFFNHMLEQLAKHGGFSLTVMVSGDLEIDDHHTVEDTALALGEALRLALQDKRGIDRYGFLLPMDESLTQVALDLSGRSYFVFNGSFAREQVGDFSTELVTHFFRSLMDSLAATLHIDVKGENTHHMIESIFKCVGRTLRQAITKNGGSVPSTKGIL